MRKRYISFNVLEEAIKRVCWIFDNYDKISVSVSGGKDSTVLYYLAINEAIKRDKEIEVFFLDQEAEYQASIDIINIMMIHQNVIPCWYQVPIYMKNASSLLSDGLFYAWQPNIQHIRKKSDIAITTIEDDYPKRFYPFLDWYESKKKDYAILVGLRAEESLNRYRAVTKHKGEKGILWSTKNKYYPLYDWTTGDVWKYILDNELPYNDIYNKMWLDCVNKREMRISNLIHDISYISLASLQKYEIDTFNALCKRIPSIHCAGRHSLDDVMFQANKLPHAFSSWLEYRDYLVYLLPESRQDIIKAKHAVQGKNTTVYRQQVKYLLLNDWKGKNSIKDNDVDKNRLVDSILLGEYT